MKVVGIDIGGANTDVAIIEVENGKLKDMKVDSRYLPMWLKKNELQETLKELLGSEMENIDGVGVTMTAELADAYKDKEEGVKDIIKKVEEVFKVPVAYVSLSGIIDTAAALKNPLKVAAANWIATSQLAAAISENCIMVDVGSTTTDIIPIKDGGECAKGRSDLERLSTGELVYTGVLRNNLATIVDKVPLHGKWYRVSSELFAITADIHLVLGNIDYKEYTCDTPDGANKTIRDSMRRIARLLCADLKLLNQQDIREIAAYIYHQQILKISEAIKEVSDRENLDKIVTTGLGMNILGRKAAEALHMECRSMDEFLDPRACIVAPAIGAAVMMGDHLTE
ncbi:MAG TPA: H4MPT-linked C1 transfer pathway protein [Methanobacteriales archaeon]|nr:MAG: putative transcriptional regulator [Methanobacteriaceae archaeon 41_258]MBC7090149.1 H4MPT-linked C1 transfer pathway protein [Methanobacteriaceae archaeon]HIH61483.1 H4MPT-linked C1 transfer pathway protein [Methanobacteriales archaeon]